VTPGRLRGVLAVFIFSICMTIWVPVSFTVAGLNLRASQLFLPFVILALATYSAQDSWLDHRHEHRHADGVVPAAVAAARTEAR